VLVFQRRKTKQKSSTLQKNLILITSHKPK